jgi:hypothetical protein
MNSIEELVKFVESHGLKVWDFGDAVTVMPVPDFTESSYLMSYVLYIWNGDKLNPKALGIEWWKDALPHMSTMEIAISHFSEFARPVGEFDRLPKPVKEESLLPH